MTTLIQLGQQAKKASKELRLLSTAQKNNALSSIIQHIKNTIPAILEANATDIKNGKENGLTEALLDRLLLTEERLLTMTSDIQTIIDLPDPIGSVDKMWKNENNLTIGKQRVPLGVVGMIYESRPNVTTDAASLCFKSGNAIILRGGKEAIHSNTLLVKVMQQALVSQNLSPYSIQLITDSSREVAKEFMQLNRFLDVLIPRGGANLIKAVLETATVPVIETGTGNCHIYVDKSAQLDMATSIIVNGKCQRPSVCNATETVLVHEEIADVLLPKMAEALAPFNVELRACHHAISYLPKAISATKEDYATEFNDYILAVKVVRSLDDALQHIETYSTKHSEVIITDSYPISQRFLQEVDAAAVYVNASSRFTDGSAFGFGGEIGISTQKLHARGPMGLNELTTTKYIVLGEGQVRP